MATLAAPTLQNLLTGVRIILNQRDPLNSFWTDEELINYLNEAVRIYFLECLQDNEGYFTTVTNLNITANTDTVILPADCFSVKSLYKKVTNGYMLLPYNNNLTEDYSTQGGSSAEAFRPYYYFQGNSILLRPTPNFSETSGLRLEYIQFPDNMIWGGDSLTAQVSPIFKQLIEMYAVYKAKLKESLVTGVNTYQGAQENLGSLGGALKNSLQKRSKYPTSIIPFNPE